MKRQYLKLLLFKTSRTIATASSSTGFPMISKHLRSFGLPLCNSETTLKRLQRAFLLTFNRGHLERRQLLDALGARPKQQYAAPVPMERFRSVIVQEHGRLSGVLAHFVPGPIGHHRERRVYAKRH